MCHSKPRLYPRGACCHWNWHWRSDRHHTCPDISESDHCGGFLGYVFIANYLGISIAYWLSFGLPSLTTAIRSSDGAFYWDFNASRHSCYWPASRCSQTRLATTLPLVTSKLPETSLSTFVAANQKQSSRSTSKSVPLQKTANQALLFSSQRSWSVVAKAKLLISEDVLGSVSGFRLWLLGPVSLLSPPTRQYCSSKPATAPSSKKVWLAV